MAMVKAIKDGHVIKVSKRSYETMFKQTGYVLLDEAEVREKEQSFDNVEEEQEEDVIETIPISEMNKEQLAEYAKKYNIDTSAAKNVREARQIIQKKIRESKM